MTVLNLNDLPTLSLDLTANATWPLSVETPIAPDQNSSQKSSESKTLLSSSYAQTGAHAGITLFDIMRLGVRAEQIAINFQPYQLKIIQNSRLTYL